MCISRRASCFISPPVFTVCLKQNVMLMHSGDRRIDGTGQCLCPFIIWGMRRRLLVGKAMVHQPPVLVLDEPTAGVDVALRQRLWHTIRDLNEKGVTIVLTTHYLEGAEALLIMWQF